MTLFLIGLSYKSAPVEIREQLAVSAARLSCVGCRLKTVSGLSEVVVLSTCNRVEIYGLAPRGTPDLGSVFSAVTAGPLDCEPYAYVKSGQAAIEHLFSVASGLESLVVGETEITGQVKQAYLAAQAARLTGPITNRLFQTALQVAKEIRTTTAIGRGATSVGSVAVELAERVFNFSQKTVMIVGAGKMGEACLRHLAKKGASSVLVVNRFVERAALLAGEFGGSAIALGDLSGALGRADIVVTSTSCPEPILYREDVRAVMADRRGRPLVLIDIAVPRNVDPAVQELENVFLYNVDDLESIVRENVRHREEELTRCSRIIAERATALMARFSPGVRMPARAPKERPFWVPVAACHA